MTFFSHLQLVATFSGAGTTVPGPVAFNERWNYSDGSYRLSGLQHSFTLPGAGTIFRGAGLLLFDLTSGDLLAETGWHQDFEGDFSGFCDALADG